MVFGQEKEREQMAISAHKGYYRQEFHKINDTNEDYKGKWNWASFFWGPFWAITKGLWIQSIVSFLLSIITGGVAAPFIWIWYGLRGNYMYYKKAIHGDVKFF